MRTGQTCPCATAVKLNDAYNVYSYVKNNYAQIIEEFQRSFGLSVNVITLLDAQNDIIQV